MSSIPPTPPSLRERYEVGGSVARGGMAQVFRGMAREPFGPVRQVAIKRLLPAFSHDERLQAMFLEEARVLASLQHANIARFYEFCRDDDGTLCIVMEWVDGVDLSRMMIAARDVGRPVAVADAALVAVCVLGALDSAHRRTLGPVFHRDVTPANILVSRRGEVKLTDFGVARAMDRMTVTQPGVLMGKMAYLAPELIAAKRASSSSDIYSLGVVLWEMLAGRRRFQAQSDLSQFMLAGRAAIPDLLELREDVPPALALVIRHMTHRLTAKRIASAQEAAERLREFMAPERAAALGRWAEEAHAATAPKW